MAVANLNPSANFGIPPYVLLAKAILEISGMPAAAVTALAASGVDPA